MLIYDQTSIAFTQRAQQMLKEILRELQFEVRNSRFLHKGYLYPIKVVIFEGSELGHFNRPFYQIGLNKKLLYLAKDSVIRDILKHELAHYLTWIEFGDVQAHGVEFKHTCQKYQFPNDVAFAKINLDEANLSKEGDLEAERVLEKVKKLLKLAQSSNSHEAELATMKANALLLRHNLNHLSDEDKDGPLFMERVLLQKKKNAKMTAIYEILKHFLVRPVISFGKGICCLEITGTKINVQLAKYIAEFLDHEMDVIWTQAKKEFHLEGLRAKNSFFIGVARGFDQKMKTSKSSFTTDEQAALIVVEKSLDKRIDQIYGRLSQSRSSSQLDETAGAAGRIKGHNLTIRQGVTGTLKNLYLSYSKS